MCSSTPRFSYGGQETRVAASWLVLVGGDMRAVRVGTRDGYTGGYGTGWVYREGYTSTQPAARGANPPAKRAPEAPARGLEWVGGCSGRSRDDPPYGPGRSSTAGPPWSSLPLSSQTAVQTAKRRELVNISVKLVKTAECH